jgi:hypothetical protein
LKSIFIKNIKRCTTPLEGVRSRNIRKKKGKVAMRQEAEAVSNSMLESLDCRGEREPDKEHPSWIRVVHDSEYVSYINECLERVDPGGAQALADAKRMYEATE